MHGLIIITYTTRFAQISNVQSRRRSCTGAISGSRSMPDLARNFYCAISAPEMHGCNLGQPKLNMCNFGHTGSGTQFLLYYLGAEAVRVQSRAAEAARVQSRACPIAYIRRVHKLGPITRLFIHQQTLGYMCSLALEKVNSFQIKEKVV